MPFISSSAGATLSLGSTAINAAYLGATRVYSGTHAEAADWAARVVTNGGTVSPETLAAVSDFCNAIEDAGIRDRFLRANLFCGDSDASLNAVRTPLYRGPSSTGTQYGNAMDANTNFVQGDYSESAGLTGNAAGGKYLLTGVPANFSSDRHISAHQQAVSAAYSRLIGVGNEHFNIAAGAPSYPASLLGLSYNGSVNVNIGATDGNAGIVFDSGDIAILTDGAPPGNFYRNGTLRLPGDFTNTIPPTLTTDIAVFGQNTTTGMQAITSSRLAGYSIGYNLTATQVADYADICRAFHQALGRA